MEFKKLNEAIDKHIALFCPGPVREELIEAARLDFANSTDVDVLLSNPTDRDWIIITFNNVFNKKSRIMSDATFKKYKKVFSSFQKAEIEIAMLAAKKDDFHSSNKYKYCTLEYFSRIDQIDKWLNVGIEVHEKKDGFILPKFNIKEKS
jgi:hypothetical protein